MLVTNLLGRKVKLYSGGENTIVAVYLDRGELVFVAENSNGGLWTTNMQSFNLLPEEKLTATAATCEVTDCTQAAVMDGGSGHETSE